MCPAMLEPRRYKPRKDLAAVVLVIPCCLIAATHRIANLNVVGKVCVLQRAQHNQAGVCACFMRSLLDGALENQTGEDRRKRRKDIVEAGLFYYRLAPS